jgi:hypothetical protein
LTPTKRHHRSGKTRTTVAVTLLFVIATTVVGIAYASGDSHHAKRAKLTKVHLAVFSHPLAPRAHTASVASHLPSSAVLAAVEQQHELFVWRGAVAPAFATANNVNNVCFADVSPSGATSGCASPQTVETQGFVSVSESGNNAVSVVVLVPDGVSQLTVNDRGGRSRTVPITNNVGEIEDASVSSLSYTMPDGKLHTEVIPASATEPLKSEG